VFDLGKSEVCGLRGDPDQAYAAELAQRGFISIAPDAIGFEDRNWSGGKNVGWFELSSRLVLGRTLLADCLQEVSLAIDYATGLPEADSDRVGFIGHSYGGRMAMWAPAWDDRIRVSVSNCGCIPYRESFAHDADSRPSSSCPASPPATTSRTSSLSPCSATSFSWRLTTTGGAAERRIFRTGCAGGVRITSASRWWRVGTSSDPSSETSPTGSWRDSVSTDEDGAERKLRRITTAIRTNAWSVGRWQAWAGCIHADVDEFYSAVEGELPFDGVGVHSAARCHEQPIFASTGDQRSKGAPAFREEVDRGGQIVGSEGVP
jgi:Prolyl oligopeptidase family